jgi:hypothetical protein
MQGEMTSRERHAISDIDTKAMEKMYFQVRSSFFTQRHFVKPKNRK